MSSPLPLLFAALALVPTLTGAETVTINPTADTTLFERDPDNNWGKQTENVAGTLGAFPASGAKSRLLLAFNIAGNVPAGSSITSARLKLRVVRTPSGGGADSTFQLLRVLVPWTEGTKSGGIPGGAPAETGETTWISRSHTATPWTNPGGKLEVDFAEDPSAQQAIQGLGNYFFDFNAEGIADLQSMLTTPLANFGWVLRTGSESTLKSARRWASREHATDPPELEITFTPPAPPPTPEVVSSNLDSITGLLSVQVDAIAGVTYSLETSSNPGGTWSPVDSQSALSDGLITLSTTPTAGTKRLFFRVSSVLTP